MSKSVTPADKIVRLPDRRTGCKNLNVPRCYLLVFCSNNHPGMLRNCLANQAGEWSSGRTWTRARTHTHKNKLILENINFTNSFYKA